MQLEIRTGLTPGSPLNAKVKSLHFREPLEVSEQESDIDEDSIT